MFAKRSTQLLTHLRGDPRSSFQAWAGRAKERPGAGHDCVFVVSDYFLPGYRAGGPIRSVAELAAVGLRADLRILTRDRDLGEECAYTGIPLKSWRSVGTAKAMYLPPHVGSIGFAWRELRRSNASCLYLNSFFAPVSGLLIVLLWNTGVLGRLRLVVAPRGQFDPGALSIRRGRKLFTVLSMAKLGLLRRIRWHAESAEERSHIRDLVGHTADVVLVSSSPELSVRRRAPERPHAPLRAVFISRISPKKGLLLAIQALSHTAHPVILDVYGPADDEGYAKQCERAAAALPRGRHVRFHGPIIHAEVAERLEGADVFLLPTLGENFGHAILEALASGCPVLIGPDTPWSGAVSRGAGLLINPRDPRDVAKALDQIAAEDAAQLRNRSDVAVEEALRHATVSAAGPDDWHRLFFGVS